MQTKPLSSISVTELTKKAGISRTAFYNNYNSVENVTVVFEGDVKDLECIELYLKQVLGEEVDICYENE